MEKVKVPEDFLIALYTVDIMVHFGTQPMSVFKSGGWLVTFQSAWAHYGSLRTLTQKHCQIVFQMEPNPTGVGYIGVYLGSRDKRFDLKCSITVHIRPCLYQCYANLTLRGPDDCRFLLFYLIINCTNLGSRV